MADASSLETREARIDRDIQDGVDAILGQATLALPSAEAGIVAAYVQKIRGVCDVDRARKDTENAADLLYIAYNVVPQSEGEIRAGISGVMNRLIASHQKSQLTMRQAMQVATGVTRQLEDAFPDWLDAREAGDRAEIETFVAKDLSKLATSVKEKALAVRDQLLHIAASYDAILKEAEDAAAKGKAALSARLADRQAAEKEMDDAKARRERLGSLVEGLEAQMAALEREAQRHALPDPTAEQGALAALLAGARTLARAVPAAARAGLPGGVLAASILRPLAGAIEAAAPSPDEARPRAEAPAGAADRQEAGRPAPDLRDAQLRLIERIETYEKERLDQSAALARVAALLDGRQGEQEMVQLALRSLDVSLDALGRSKEIAEEVAALSVSLSETGIGEIAAAGAGQDGTEGAGRLDAAVDAFFIRETARWRAVFVVSDGFNALFAEGWSRLNKLSGTFVTGDQLGAYLKGASAKLAAIAAEREAAAVHRIASLQDHRDKLTRGA